MNRIFYEKLKKNHIINCIQSREIQENIDEI